MLGKSKRCRGSSGEVVLTIFGTNDHMPQKTRGRDTEQRSETLTVGSVLDSLTKKHAIYEARPRIRGAGGFRNGGVCMTLGRRPRQFSSGCSISTSITKKRISYDVSFLEGPCWSSWTCRPSSSAPQGGRATYFVDFPDDIVLCSDLEQGSLWARTLEELATQLEFRLPQHPKQRKELTEVVVKVWRADLGTKGDRRSLRSASSHEVRRSRAPISTMKRQARAPATSATPPRCPARKG